MLRLALVLAFVASSVLGLRITGVVTTKKVTAVELYLDAPGDLKSHVLSVFLNGEDQKNLPLQHTYDSRFVYVTSDKTAFNEYFGIQAEFEWTVLKDVDGNDPFQLSTGTAQSSAADLKSKRFDHYGIASTDGAGLPWDTYEGWAYRVNFSPASKEFKVSEWTVNTLGLKDVKENVQANKPFPFASFKTDKNSEVRDFRQWPTVVDLVLSGVSSVPGTPGLSVVELYTLGAVDLSVHEVRVGNTNVKLQGQVEKNRFVYITNDKKKFRQFFEADKVEATLSAKSKINGLDTSLDLMIIEEKTLVLNGLTPARLYYGADPKWFLVDSFGTSGDINNPAGIDSGLNQIWDFKDGWAYRKPETFYNSVEFNADNWVYSTPGVFTAIQNTNVQGEKPFPLQNYRPLRTSVFARTDLLLTAVGIRSNTEKPASVNTAQPTFVELKALDDVHDYVDYSIGLPLLSAGTRGPTCTLSKQSGVTFIPAGTYVYLTNSRSTLNTFLGSKANNKFTWECAALNNLKGQEAVELITNGRRTDSWGFPTKKNPDIYSLNGGVAVRKRNTGPDGVEFIIPNWKIYSMGSKTSLADLGTLPLQTYDRRPQGGLLLTGVSSMKDMDFIEMYALRDIRDLSVYRLIVTLANNDELISKPHPLPPISVKEGEFIHIVNAGTAAAAFKKFFGFGARIQMGLNLNGHRAAIEIVYDGTNEDVFGTMSTENQATAKWTYEDGWAYRRSETDAEYAWNPDNWMFGAEGMTAVDPNVSPNVKTDQPFPLMTYRPTLYNGADVQFVYKGNRYEVVPKGETFADASREAQMKGGRLMVIPSGDKDMLTHVNGVLQKLYQKDILNTKVVQGSMKGPVALWNSGKTVSGKWVDEKGISPIYTKFPANVPSADKLSLALALEDWKKFQVYGDSASENSDGSAGNHLAVNPNTKLGYIIEYKDDPISSGLTMVGIADGPDGARVVELYARKYVRDLSEYSITLHRGTQKAKTVYLPMKSVREGDTVYVTYDAQEFKKFYGKDADVESKDLDLTGVESVQLRHLGKAVDTYGYPDKTPSVDKPFTDSWVYRKPNSEPSPAYDKNTWEEPKKDALAGLKKNSDASSDARYPLGSFVPISPGGLIVTGVLDGDNNCDAVELYAKSKIEKLDDYGVGEAVNAMGTQGVNHLLPAGSMKPGEYMYLTNDKNCFQKWRSQYCKAPADCTGRVVEWKGLNVDGDDAIEVFQKGHKVDTFGNEYQNGAPTAWAYQNGWSYRNALTGPSASFKSSSWTVKQNTDNSNLWPVGTYYASCTGLDKATCDAKPKCVYVNGVCDSKPDDRPCPTIVSKFDCNAQPLCAYNDKTKICYDVFTLCPKQDAASNCGGFAPGVCATKKLAGTGKDICVVNATVVCPKITDLAQCSSKKYCNETKDGKCVAKDSICSKYTTDADCSKVDFCTFTNGKCVSKDVHDCADFTSSISCKALPKCTWRTIDTTCVDDDKICMGLKQADCVQEKTNCQWDSKGKCRNKSPKCEKIITKTACEAVPIDPHQECKWTIDNKCKTVLTPCNLLNSTTCPLAKPRCVYDSQSKSCGEAKIPCGQRTDQVLCMANLTCDWDPKADMCNGKIFKCSELSKAECGQEKLRCQYTLKQGCVDRKLKCDEYKTKPQCEKLYECVWIKASSICQTKPPLPPLKLLDKNGFMCGDSKYWIASSTWEWEPAQRQAELGVVPVTMEDPGGRLAVIADKWEYDCVMGALQSNIGELTDSKLKLDPTKSAKSTVMWVGARLMTKSNSWKWVDNSLVPTGTAYPKWKINGHDTVVATKNFDDPYVGLVITRGQERILSLGRDTRVGFLIENPGPLTITGVFSEGNSLELFAYKEADLYRYAIIVDGKTYPLATKKTLWQGFLHITGDVNAFNSTFNQPQQNRLANIVINGLRVNKNSQVQLKYKTKGTTSDTYGPDPADKSSGEFAFKTWAYRATDGSGPDGTSWVKSSWEFDKGSTAPWEKYAWPGVCPYHCQATKNDGICNPYCELIPECEKDGNDCKDLCTGDTRLHGQICSKGNQGDGTCDKQCNTQKCGFDYGDCKEAEGLHCCVPDCHKQLRSGKDVSASAFNDSFCGHISQCCSTGAKDFGGYSCCAKEKQYCDTRKNQCVDGFPPGAPIPPTSRFPTPPPTGPPTHPSQIPPQHPSAPTHPAFVPTPTDGTNSTDGAMIGDREEEGKSSLSGGWIVLFVLLPVVVVVLSVGMYIWKVMKARAEDPVTADHYVDLQDDLLRDEDL